MRKYAEKKTYGTIYRCTCPKCGSNFELNPKELNWLGGLTFTWKCASCEHQTGVSWFKLMRDKITFKTEIDYFD